MLFQLGAKFVEAWLVAPAAALVLALLLSRSGRVAVSNRELLDAVLSPLGLAAAALLALLWLSVFLIEQAAIMALAAWDGASRPAASRLLLGVWRVTRFAALQLVVLAAGAIPLAIAAAFTWQLLLTRYDIYFYWQKRPPEFWLAVGIGTVLAAVGTILSTWLQVRWSLALPVVLFEGQSVRAACRTSRELTRGTFWRILLILGGWLAIWFAAATGVTAAYRWLAALLLDWGETTPVWLIAMLLAGQALLLATSSLVLMIGLALLTRRLYLAARQQCGPPPTPAPAEEPAAAGPWPRRIVGTLLAGVVLLPLIIWIELPWLVPEPRPVGITAHRGHARAAPENTLAALRAAIASGADYAEIDARQTSDGVVVLLHDRDLRRVASDSRRIDQVSLAQLKQLDVGRWFGSQFTGERVPTLAEAIDLCRGELRLNIELKSTATDRTLAAAVTAVVRDADFADQCLITSFHLADCREARRLNPRQRTGLIVAQAVGDLSRLDVDALSVRADFLSDDLLARAQRQGREVHVWTVNDPRQMSRFLQRGVDNLMTSDPDLAIRVRGDWQALSSAERLVLSSRIWLGIEP
ncbi:MAG: glycerophosphodiester phosphodiesterase family protein [Pirellulaceae bacterium]|nr:glycerophosphodiester phosphodiesterase family protein [Pirellulaceae bacterium]